MESVDEAARLYQLGMANHKAAETPDNKRSSRSHTVFSIKIMRQKHGEEILLRCVCMTKTVNVCYLKLLNISYSSGM